MLAGRTLLTPKRLLAAVCLTAALGVCAAWLGGAKAGVIAGMRFDEAARVGGKTLELNGAGLRTAFIVKGYAAALYLPERARNATVVLGDRGPKRLQIRVLREAGPDLLVNSLNRAIRQNHSETQVQALSGRLAQLDDTLGLVGTAHKGDVIDLDFSPDSGTMVAINGTPRGRPIPGEDLYQAVLRAFLGDRPVDDDLKRSLLGG